MPFVTSCRPKYSFINIFSKALFKIIISDKLSHRNFQRYCYVPEYISLVSCRKALTLIFFEIDFLINLLYSLLRKDVENVFIRAFFLAVWTIKRFLWKIQPFIKLGIKSAWKTDKSLENPAYKYLRAPNILLNTFITILWSLDYTSLF